MPLFKKIREIVLSFKYAEVFKAIAIYFALIYHVSFFVVFWVLKVYPMVIFNVFSVILFSILSFTIFTKKSFKIQYFFMYIEVVAHQILGDWFLGGVASFHAFIFLVGTLPLLTFKKSFKLSAFYGLFSVILYTILEVASLYIEPKYIVSESVLIVIKTINISSFAFVNITGLLAYAYLAGAVENNLHELVEKKTLELQEKNERLLKIQTYIINSLASLVDNRDIDTGKHIQRTQGYVDLISKKALSDGLFKKEIDDRFVEYIGRAAPLHDVGKIIVPDDVLKKPGQLTPHEFDQMKLHAMEGGRIIREVFAISDDEDFIKVASNIAMYHHEKWDGSGYPYGLSGSDIPLEARIMAVADTFDALVSRRCYKEPIPIDEAYKLMTEDSGRHFDPDVLQIFLSMKDEIAQVMKRFSD